MTYNGRTKEVTIVCSEWQYSHVHSPLSQIFFKTNINAPLHTSHKQILEKYKLLGFKHAIQF